MHLKDRITPDDAVAVTLRLQSGAALAEKLGTSAKYANAVLRKEGIVRIPGPLTSDRKICAAQKAERQAARSAAAQEVAKGTLTMAEAQARTGASERTMYRYLKAAHVPA